MIPRNKILRSVYARYYYIITFFLYHKKGDLPLMYSCVFWCEFTRTEYIKVGLLYRKKVKYASHVPCPLSPDKE